MPILKLLRYHLKSLARFQGRDSRDVFLPWGMICVQIAGFGCILALAPTALVVSGIMPEMFGEQAWIVSTGLFMVVIAGLIGLVAASIARRLHDCGRSLAWAVPPVIMLVVLGGMMPYTFAHIPLDGAEAGGLEPDGFVKLMGLVFVYLLSLLPVLVFLGQDGEAGDNRFGAAPARPGGSVG